MLDITDIVAEVALDITRDFVLDPTASLRLLDASGAEILTLTMSDSGWLVTDAKDGSIRVEISEGVAATAAQLRNVATLVYFRTDAEARLTEWGGESMQVKPWTEPWDRTWVFESARPQNIYVEPELVDQLLLSDGVSRLLLSNGVDFLKLST